MNSSIPSALVITLAAVLLPAGHPSASAASAVVLVNPGQAGLVHSFAVAPTTDAAVDLARMNLSRQGYPTSPFACSSSAVPGYGALAGETDSNGRLRAYGICFAAPSLANSMDLATRLALAKGARAPRVLSVWTDVNFTHPRTISPWNSQTGVHRPTTLTWGDVPFASNYEIQIDYLPTGGPAQLADRAIVNGLGYTTTQLGPGRNYRWRVQAISDDGSVRGPWSPFSRFATLITR